jgi:hypothetical protein
MGSSRVDVGGLGDPRPRNVEKAHWRMLAEIAQIFACLESHSASVFCIFLLLYTSDNMGAQLLRTGRLPAVRVCESINN